MPDDQQELRRINWGEVFPFTQLFRSFRLAVHPSKLLLALVALLLTYSVGRVMDKMWPKTVIACAATSSDIKALGTILNAPETRSEVRMYIDLRGGCAFCTWHKQAAEACKSCKNTQKKAECMPGKGIFATLMDHQIATFRQGLTSLLSLNFGLASRTPTGLKAAIVDGLGGVVWFYFAHWFYATVFTVIAMLIWSLLGGAICRIAALQAARDEKIPIRQAIKFSGRKLFSFFTAPLIPVVLVAVIGVVIFLGGLFAAIPYVGELFAGVFWPLAMFGGFIMVLVMIGGVSGFMLMFPTIAVEGSDSFDALSRSFSYVYSKPWRTSFYVLVSSIYGSICYLFVRLFAHMMLNATHKAVGLGMNVDGSAYDVKIGKLDAIWSHTSLLELDRFWGHFAPHQLNGSEKLACLLIAFWTFIVVGFVASFVISFFFSSSTLIYYLLRREVDATDLEDVYLEEYEEEELGAKPAAAPASAPAAPPAEASAPPAAPPPQPEPPAGGCEGGCGASGG